MIEERDLQILVNKLKRRKLGIQDVQFKYNHKEGKLYIEPSGISNVTHEQAFYEHLIEDILGIDSFFFSRINDVKQDIHLNVKVQPDGYFNFKQVDLSFNISFNHQMMIKNRERKIDYVFRQVAPYYKYLSNVVFGYHEGSLGKIVFEAKLDMDSINSVFKNTKINNQILSQWFTVVSYINKNSDDYYHCSLPIIDGKMCYNMRVESIKERFKI